MHVHLLDDEGNVLAHYCEQHFREAKAAGKLAGAHLTGQDHSHLVRADGCGGRCDRCPRPAVP